LLKVGMVRSKQFTDRISFGELSEKPGWVRMSIHPTTTDAELDYCLDALCEISAAAQRLAKDYRYDPRTNKSRQCNSSASEFEANCEIPHWLEF
jgi:hypothetical protein